MPYTRANWITCTYLVRLLEGTNWKKSNDKEPVFHREVNFNWSVKVMLYKHKNEAYIFLPFLCEQFLKEYTWQKLPFP